MASKSPNGAGTIYHRKDGRYEGAAYVLAADGTRRRAHVYGRDHAEAQRKLSALLTASSNGIPRPDGSLTIQAYMEWWLSAVARDKVRATTYTSYEALTRLYVIPMLGTKRLNTISVREAQEAFDAALRRGQSVSKVHQIRAVLRAALTIALRREMVVRNIAKLVVLPPLRRPEVEPWTPDEARRFLDTSKTHRSHIAFVLLMTYGIRKGEVLGLTWDDVDFAKNVIKIRQQVQLVDGTPTAVPPKTLAGRRTLPLVPAVRAELLELARTRGIHLDLTSSPVPAKRYSLDRLIACTETGGPIGGSSLSSTFHQIAHAAGLRRTKIHHLRHMVATLLGTMGVPDKDIQLILGHSDIHVTQQIYQHGSPAVQQQAMTAISQVVSPVATAGLPVATDERACGGCSQEQPSTRPFESSQGGWKPRNAAPETEVMPPVTAAAAVTNVTSELVYKITTAEGIWDPLDFRTISTAAVANTLAGLPVATLRSLHKRAQQHILGSVAVTGSRQSVSSRPCLIDHLAIRRACRAASTEQLRRRSFPLNLVPIPAADTKEKTR